MRLLLKCEFDTDVKIEDYITMMENNYFFIKRTKALSQKGDGLVRPFGKLGIGSSASASESAMASASTLNTNVVFNRV